MTLPYNDEKNYLFDREDTPENCFICKYPGERLLVVRKISSMMLVHLCGDCMLNFMEDLPC